MNNVTHSPGDEHCEESNALREKLKSAEQRLHILRQEFEKNSNFINSIFHSIHDLLIIINLDGSINTINGKTEDVLEYKDSELISKNYSLIVPDTSPLSDITNLTARLRREHMNELNTEFTSKNG
ncbi:MAG: PAS domain-containing protein, partial [Porticoccus sp.]